MSAEGRLNVVLMWHMHQPQYRDTNNGQYEQPWTYLHAIKDYVDMAAHLEANPQARAVVNFAPVLLDQLDDYAAQVQGFLHGGGVIHDSLLNSLAHPAPPVDDESRLHLLRACLRANEKRFIDRFPAYRALADMARWCIEHPQTLGYLDEQFFTDILVWYHLAWLGETVRRSDRRIQALQDRARGYSLQERRELLGIIGELLGGLVERYRRLAEAGRIELSVSPYAHPIVPLLLDLHAAREAMPEVSLPSIEAYPGGRQRAEWHLREAQRCFRRHFGFEARGCWPSEGGVSEATLELLEEHGFQWAASGESVLFNSLRCDPHQQEQRREDSLFRPYHLQGRQLACFFRDDGLSDAIGFTYSDWHADDAVANLIHHLENIAAAEGSLPVERRVVSIILDGENAWEYYPENGYYFLSTLYQKLVEHPRLNLTTFSACLDVGVEAAPLSRLVAGSWVYGTFSTWIGDADKNRGWEMLAEAKRVFDETVAEGRLDAETLRAAEEQLAICEGSDWFWWFGDYNPSGTVQDFDRLFRLQLANLYQRLGRSAPEYLAHAFSFGGTTAAVAHGGVMRHGQPGGD
ncbi:glycoside hydrolase family 57 protein [Thiohalobacter sp. IOR34]|uniref:glycoside hydrolase family 57 protein n=1 Tax=Thiohalobacter sp. IOR34 TaxID=3057176 RepID=UPI0025B023A3|nr:glycoside hydrolase family 57 protein [Thiohalobacter sp. IOR34]WJW74538.1 glycoside hydrolase family 57 protein [Thiohalobacter sp. IOR34]